MEEKREQDLHNEAAGTEEATVDTTEPETEAGEAPEAESAAQTEERSGEESGSETKEQPGTEAGEQPEQPEQKEAGDGANEKGFFAKKKKKDKRDEQIEELTDRVKRTMAEFENFRKRNEREKSQMYEIGARDIIEKLLPVMDNFERGIQSIPEEELKSPVGEGMTMIYKQMVTVFEQIGVKAIEAVGAEFDPNLHNAVMHVEDEEAGENIIVEEFQKGYQYRDTVIRHSMVKVAN